VGRIGRLHIRASEWVAANEAFLSVTQHFDDHTKRVALVYPGSIASYRFCGDCGSPVTVETVPWPEGTAACTRAEYLLWLSDHAIPGFTSKYVAELI
jgi:hypothetical protein